MDLIIIAGMPASGKSTAAAAVSKAFGYPIIEKDYIKEGLFDVLGFENYQQKRALDYAANETLLRVLKAMLKADVSVIVDNNFDTESN
ncbi:MAG: AAA family ATPase, partial [Firmicutes bacterium]|nr:AAA family ATPase [Bacillota bacterium]